MKTSESLLLQLHDRIEGLPHFDKTNIACVGFDGFVDTIQRAVHTKGPEGPIFFSTITEFAAHLGNLQGKSGQVELVSRKIKIGGNAPIMSNALGRLGIHNTCVAAMGFPEIHPLFRQMDPLCHGITLSPPGKSNAFEFGDGKIIFSELSVFDEFDWSYIKKTIDLVKIRTMVHDCRLFAFVDWVNLPHATSLWKGFRDDVIKSHHRKDALFLFDLCDPSKKSPQQIREVLELISSFSEFGKVTLGLNENEANKVWMALNDYDLTVSDKVKLPQIEIAGDFIFDAMNIETLLIHPPDRTLAFTRHASENTITRKLHHFLELDGKMIAQPAVLTGAGDNLNAGYCLGWLAGLETQYCILLGMAAAGAYILNGVSPEIEDLTDYVEQWTGEIAPASLRENADADVGLFMFL
jgi:hypothetical protein